MTDVSENIIGKLIVKYKKCESYYIESCVYVPYISLSVQFTCTFLIIFCILYYSILW